MYTLCALLPIAAALVLMTKFRVSPGKALPLAWGLAVLSGFFVWHMQPDKIAAASLLGVMKSLDIILIVYGAVLLLNILRNSGAIEAVNRSFASVSGDRRIQAVIIAWLFSNFIEGAAGFGAAPALAAPLLAGLGFPVMSALMVSLVLNSLAVPFGAAGTPVLTAEAVLRPDLQALQMNESVFNAAMISDLTSISALSGMFLPFVAVTFMILLSGDRRKWRSIAEIFPFALFAGIAYVVPWKLTAIWLGPELPSILGAAVGLAVVLPVLKTGILTPRHVWDFPKKEQDTLSATLPETRNPAMAPFKAWLPYASIALLLVVTRLPFLPVKQFLTDCIIIRLPELFGVKGTQFQWSVLVNPGIFPFLAVALLSACYYRLPAERVLKIAKDSEKQIRMSALAIAFSFALVQVMIFSGTEETVGGLPGMLTVTAQAIAGLLGKFYAAAAPLIGVFGTFFSGSCTVSNILFGAIQFNTAHLLHLSEPVIMALQNVGGGLGSMIRISGVVAACATVNAQGKEGKLLMLNLIPLSVMVLLTLLASAVLKYF